MDGLVRVLRLAGSVARDELGEGFLQKWVRVPVALLVPEIHRILSWLGVPLALLLPFVVNNIWIAFSKTSVQGLSICTNAAPARWQILWAPAQLMTVVVIALLVVREWRKARI